MIRAECHSDDYVFEVDFDATAALSATSDAEWLELARCGFGGDYPADDVARAAADDVAGLETLFEYCASHDVGFECHVEADDALAWLSEHRPALADVVADVVAATLAEADHSVPGRFFPNE